MRAFLYALAAAVAGCDGTSEPPNKSAKPGFDLGENLSVEEHSFKQLPTTELTEQLRTESFCDTIKESDMDAASDQCLAFIDHAVEELQQRCDRGDAAACRSLAAKR